MEEIRKIRDEVISLASQGQVPEAKRLVSNERQNLTRVEVIECEGHCHFYAREYREAIAKYEEAMMLDQACDIARYHYLVGIQEERENNLEAAFRRYQAAIEIEPEFVDAYVELGGLLVKVEDYEGALTCYIDALALDRTDLRNFANKFAVLKKLADSNSEYSGQYQIAAAEYDAAKNTLPPLNESITW